MANAMPSLTALLGLVAVAGFQNRDKIGAFVKGLTGADTSIPAAANAQIPGGIGGALGGLLDQFTKNGQGDVAGSWIGTGQNTAVNGGQLSQALGPDIVAMLAKKTGAYVLGTDLCVPFIEKANKEYKFSDSCKTAMKTMHEDRKITK